MFLLFIFINNYIILPTFIASIIASYFSANLRDSALIKDADLKKYQESWIDMNPEGSPLLGKSYLTFKKIGDRAPKAEQPWDFSKFHSLTEMLMMKKCMLGFSKNNDPMKYKMAIARLKQRAGNGKKFTVDYKTMCVLLLSIAEKARPVTIVDKLRREKVGDSTCTPCAPCCCFLLYADYCCTYYSARSYSFFSCPCNRSCH